VDQDLSLFLVWDQSNSGHVEVYFVLTSFDAYLFVVGGLLWGVDTLD